MVELTHDKGIFNLFNLFIGQLRIIMYNTFVLFCFKLLIFQSEANNSISS